MAIAFDAASSASTINSAHTSKTWSHTCTGSDRVLIVGIGTFNSTGGGKISGITYNGVSMTLVAEASAQSNIYSSMWYLIAPSTGANNIVASFASQTYDWCASASYTGVAQSGFPDASSSGNNTSTSITGTVTTIADNAWTVMTPLCNAAGITGGTGTTVRAISPTNGRQAICDSNGDITPAGSSSLIVNCNNDSNAQVIVSMEPAADAPVFVPTMQII